MLNMPNGLFALSRSWDRDKPLSLQDIAAFRRDGHILLRGVATPEEITRFRPAICEAVYKYSTETRNLSERDTYGRAFLQIMNLWRRDERVKEFVLARKFARIAADLLGVERVRLYHDQALFKEPNGGHTPWHQDQYYWPLDTDKTITMWMPLVDVGAEMGLMRFASGSHRAGPIGSIQISDESAEVYEKYIAANGLPVVQASRMNAGDATFHTGWTIHGAGANLSPDKTREVMTVIYFADGARVTQPQNEHQAADWAAWLDSKPPGELADSYLNPICTTGAQASRLQ
jgi:ectoine hydroxylase-related dioxygenase (phytanoyl-CoA dioxygenase family)